MRILVDMDGVITDLMNPLLANYNMVYGTNLQVEDITQWELPEAMHEIMTSSKNLFSKLPFLPGAYEGLHWLLDSGHDVVILTSGGNQETIIAQKGQWVKKNLPDFMKRLIITCRKDLVEGDIIFDDYCRNLETSPAKHKIVMDWPWNRHYKIAYRAYNWNCVPQIIKQLGGRLK